LIIYFEIRFSIGENSKYTIKNERFFILEIKLAPMNRGVIEAHDF